MAVLVLSSAQKPAATFKPVAVIELFTSEGCSSCPPADKLLAKTVTDASATDQNVFALAFHVDYWNRLGWRDSFSTKQFSGRQGMYASAMNLNGVYTPQMIVNGTTEFVGSDKSALDAALLKSLNNKSDVEFKNLLAIKNGSSLEVSYRLNGAFKGSLVNFALITLHAATSVKNGENRGRVLEHTNVVRQFISSAALLSGKIVFNGLSNYNPDNTAIIAFVQQANSLRIVAAAKAKTKG